MLKKKTGTEKLEEGKKGHRQRYWRGVEGGSGGRKEKWGEERKWKKQIKKKGTVEEKGEVEHTNEKSWK